MDKPTVDYFLSPEYQQDSSLLKNLARLLELSSEEGMLEVVETELFLIFVEYANALRKLRQVRTELVADLSVLHPSDKDVRQLAADKFVNECRLAHGVAEQTSVFVRHCAEELAGKV